jgi:hypothetical protein
MTLTFLDLQDEVLHDEFDPGKYRTLVKRWLNIALGKVARAIDIEETEQTDTSIVFVPGTSIYPIPAGIEIIDFISVEGRNLIELDINEMDESDDEARGAPTHFAVYGSDIVFWPAPDAALSPRVRFTGRVATLSADTDLLPIDDEYSDVLVNYAKSKAFASEDDGEMSTFFLQQFRDGLREMRGQSERTRNDVRQIQGMMPRGSAPRFQRP